MFKKHVDDTSSTNDQNLYNDFDQDFLQGYSKYSSSFNSKKSRRKSRHNCQNNCYSPTGATESVEVTESTRTAGANGTDGKSAYEIAVDNGFDGNEEEWLASLQGGPIGPTGADGEPGPAGATGADGDSGPTGADGKSAYEIAVDNGFDGDEDEWLVNLQGGPTGPAGLIGPQGEKGDTGNIGPAGPIGPQGEKGNTGNIGPAGPIGPQGEKGNTGSTGSAGPIGPQGEKGNTGDTGPAGPIGPQGEQGDTGPFGPQGERGPVGPAGANGTNVRLLETYDSLLEFQIARPSGNVGDIHLVEGHLHTWDPKNNMWMDLGNLTGPTGPPGATERIIYAQNTCLKYGERLFC